MLLLVPPGTGRAPRMKRWPGSLTRKWSKFEIGFWLAAADRRSSCFPEYLTLGSQILIAGLFALSLDLILGYARIISLGHAAYFRRRRLYRGAAGQVRLGQSRISGLSAAAIVAAIVGLITSFLVVRGQDLTRLMVTLGIGLMLFEAANQASSITGGVDGLVRRRDAADFRRVRRSALDGRTAYLYSLAGVCSSFSALHERWSARRSAEPAWHPRR